MIYRFDGCELDTGRITLHRDGAQVHVEPQVFDLLHCLVERRDQMVGKEDLLDLVWGSRFVSESALTSRIKSARRAVGDDGTRQRIIRTVHGKGYQFVAEVAETTIDPAVVDVDPPPTPTGPHASLPLPVHRLIGRDDLIDTLDDALAATRLLTIVGTAGVGKTSIGLELARRWTGRRRDGVVMVELVSVGDRDGALAAIATALDVGVRHRTSLDAAIVDMLQPRDLLLVVDNYEHLVEPIATLVDQILRSAPAVTVLATGREPLALPGERVHVVDPLEVGGLDELPLDQLAEVPAVALFMERARSVDARIELTAATAPAVAEICRRLDGIPLAIELAASRTHAIDITEIARRLDERLRLLRAVRRGADPRHGTLADAISWSYDLLDHTEQRLFSELAVFAGAFDLDAAESVCDTEDVLDLLTRLTQRSMITVRRPSSGGTRYELLETLREFGRSRIDDTQHVALFEAHARHFADVSVTVEAELRTVDEHRGVQRADGSFADLRAAQRFAVQVGDVDTALRLITSIREYAMRTLRYEVFTWADAAAPLVEHDPHPLRPVLTALRAYGAFVRGEFDTALALADAADADDGGPERSGLAGRVRGNVLYLVGQVADGMAECSRLVEAAVESGDPSRVTHANYISSVAAGSIGAVVDARRMYEAAFDAARRSGSPTDLASAWMAKGFATRHDDEAALDAFASADRLARTAGNRWMSAFARTEASSLRVGLGDLERGCAGLADTVDTWYRAGEWAQQWLTLSRCVIALDQLGHHTLAAQVFGAIERHTSVDAPPVMPTVRDLAVRTRAALDERFGARRAAELRAEGELLSDAAVVHRTRSALLGLADDR